MKKPLVQILILVSILIILVPISFFLFWFGSGNISSSPELWGQFGDYIGGTMNPLLAIINIGVFILLTNAIQQASKLHHKDSLVMAKKVVEVQLKHEEFKEFKIAMDAAMDNWRANLPDLDAVRRIDETFNRLSTIFHLFSELEQSPQYKSVAEEIKSIVADYNAGNFGNPLRRHTILSKTYTRLINALGLWVLI